MARRQGRWARCFGAAIVLLVACGGCAGRAAVAGSEPPADEPERGGTPVTGPSEWREIGRLVGEQKYQAAVEAVSALRRRAQEDGSQVEWRRALVEEAQLTAALGGVESSVRLLRGTAWPEDALSQTVLRLLYAHSLVRYLDVYGWEIAQRERVAGVAESDLAQWTRTQIVAAVDAAYGELWASRQDWGLEPNGVLADYLTTNDYPDHIRGTLRDTVSYLWTEFLANTGYWEPEASNTVYLLDLESLAAGEPAGVGADRHPLERLAAVLGDLERWHRQGGRAEAAFEATLERLRRLSANLSDDADRKVLRGRLESALDRLGRSYPWWSAGQAELARLIQAESETTALVAARDAARAGRDEHPESIGGRRCASLVASLEAPAMNLEAMRTDGANRRSLSIQHKNLDAVYFRAYALDLGRVLAGGEDFNLLPGHQEVERLLSDTEPSARWQTRLPATPDLRQHRTYVVPPFEEPGLYVVVASAREDFAVTGNRVQAVNFVLSDLVLMAGSEGRSVQVDVRSGASGEALTDVEVEVLRLDFSSGHRRVAAARTGENGRVRLAVPGTRHVDAVAIARRGEDVNFERVWVARPQRRSERDSTEALIYTDRSIYRPQQDVLWKVVAYQRSEQGRRLTVAPGREMTVELHDANGEVVAGAEVVSNEFGSASGRFSIAAGRLLGGWWIETSLGGYAEVRVEEYKRPTFEVELVEPREPLRLNRAATLRGEVEYYFGLPVVEGDVRWRVARRPRYPDWWSWFRPVPARGEELVAGGTAELGADGSFELSFVPEADEREAKDGVTYSYSVSVEVTDSGGETRSAERTYRLGYVTIEAAIRSQRGFLLAGEGASFNVERADLDGTPRAGTGRWRLVTLRQPSRVLLPADEPVPMEDEDGFRTAGDAQRPRWSADYRVTSRLRSWEDGETVSAGALEHDAEGRATLRIAELGPGAHRLYYETDDPFGATFEARHEFLVAGPAPLALPAVLAVEQSTVAVGGRVRLLVHSGLAGQEMQLEIARPGGRTEERRLTATAAPQVIELEIEAADRELIPIRLTVLNDHQLLTLESRIVVPPENRGLKVRFETFRDLLRPGSRERWRVAVAGADDEALAAGAAEVLAYMYDRSLDLFADHHPPAPSRPGGPSGQLDSREASLGASRPVLQREKAWYEVPRFEPLSADRLRFYDSYGIGGPGRLMLRRMGGPAMESAVMMAEPMMPAPTADTITVASESPLLAESAESDLEASGLGDLDGADTPPTGGTELRSDFSETAFWEPHLVTGADGGVAFEFTVPDSLTEWNVWVHALTRDLRYGRLTQRVRTSKELLVRPYLPRFLREGDRAELRVVVQNAGEETLSGSLEVDLLDPVTDLSVAAEFGWGAGDREARTFTVEPGGSASFPVALTTPARVGEVALRVVGEADGVSDGELRPLSLLPGRFHLAQSRFAALQGEARRELAFADLAAADDPSRIDEQLVVTLDGQLFYSVLNALPYLVDYPYECTEQTLNRFLSTGIVGSVFEQYPAVARMAARLAERETPLAPWPDDDPNRRMVLEETPWRRAAGGGEADDPLLRILDPRVAAAQRDASLAKLVEAQTSLGGFPWWPGGAPSPYMTIYVVNGLSRAREFGVEVPQETVANAWRYLHRYYVDELADDLETRKLGHEVVTYINYVLSNYPDVSWTGGVFSDDDRARMLDHSFTHWREHSPLTKSYLALTLERAGRRADADLVFDSVMDSARTTEDEGTFWAPEDRAWLWYNDTIETHAFALRTLGELNARDPRRRGLVHWLMLNKKLNHWKSTRATAEVIYSLVHYLAAEGELGQREAATVSIGEVRREFAFEPDEYTGAHNQWVVAGDALDPETDSTVVVEKRTPGLLFASATWHFSTEKLPNAASSDFFGVERSYFKRVRVGEEWVLEPLTEGARLAVGDQVEVQLTLSSRHAAEYVHLRDPRAAGFEPETVTSGFKWDLGIGWYEQVRDSGTDFFFEGLPVGEYKLGYRLRANLAGTFRAAPAIVQSMYAPEFNAYSSGVTLSIESGD